MAPYTLKSATVIAALVFTTIFVGVIVPVRLPSSPVDAAAVTSASIDGSMAIVDTDRAQHHRLLQSQNNGNIELDVTPRIVGGTTAQANPSYAFTAGAGLCGSTLIWPEYVCLILVCRCWLNE